MSHQLKNAPLGQKYEYISQYQPDLLFPIPRQEKRHEIGIDEDNLPFKGVDIWGAYELSWLDIKGKPVCAIAEFILPCESPNLIESKSFKLYLNSFNNSAFSSAEMVQAHLQKDVSEACGKKIAVELTLLHKASASFGQFYGHCLDFQDIDCQHYQLSPEVLTSDPELIVTETLYSNLLKSNCLVTAQPDWGSVWIEYTGPQIDKANLLRYIVSFRNHNEFHEQCVERIFSDLMQYAKTEQLSVYARYTRRGGLDINPFRSTHEDKPKMLNRLVRQ